MYVAVSKHFVINTVMNQIKIYNSKPRNGNKYGIAQPASFGARCDEIERLLMPFYLNVGRLSLFGS